MLQTSVALDIVNNYVRVLVAPFEGTESLKLVTFLLRNFFYLN